MGNKMAIGEETECRALQTAKVILVICVILGLKLAVTTRKGLWQTFPKHPLSATVGVQVMGTWTFGITPSPTLIQKKAVIYFFFKETEHWRILFPFTKIYVGHCHPSPKNDNRISEFVQLLLRLGLCKVFTRQTGKNRIFQAELTPVWSEIPSLAARRCKGFIFIALQWKREMSFFFKLMQNTGKAQAQVVPGI